MHSTREDASSVEEAAMQAGGLTIAQAIVDARVRLARAGIDSAEAEAASLVAHVLGRTRGELELQRIVGATVPSTLLERLNALLDRRVRREPLQHITGAAYFRSLELAVGPGVFVPRPETEGLVDLVFNRLATAPDVVRFESETPTEQHRPLVIDLGTGSGAIALSIATEAPGADVWGIEASAVAFTWAKQNFRSISAPNAHLLRAGFDDELPRLAHAADVVVSNPPYIPTGMVPRDPEVRLFDPDLALYSGEDGLDAIRVIAHRARSLVRDGGWLILEHGEDQGASVRDVLSGAGWLAPTTTDDLAGRNRYTSAQAPHAAVA